LTASFEPAPIIVTALIGRQDQAFFDAERAAYFPPERNQLAAHLTMFHHLPPSLAPELRQRLVAETHGMSRPRARIADVISLGRGVAYRIDCDELVAIRARLATAFVGMLTPQDAGGWRAHVTVQNKVQPMVAKELLAKLRAGFRPRPVAIVGLAAYWYRGGPWEMLSKHLFSA
jgi:hypothetical protein